MENYFKKYRKRSWSYLFSSTLFALITFYLYHSNLEDKIIITSIAALICLGLLLSCINNLTSYITKTITWFDLEDFINAICNAPCLLKRVRPDVAHDHGAKYYDLDIEVFNTNITLSGVPVFYKKQIVEAVEQSNLKLFRIEIKYGPKKGDNHNTEIMIT